MKHMTFFPLKIHEKRISFPSGLGAELFGDVWREGVCLERCEKCPTHQQAESFAVWLTSHDSCPSLLPNVT